MESVFLAQSFKEPDRELIAAVVAVIKAAEFRVVTGDALGGGQVSARVQAMIQASDACVAVATAANKAHGAPTHAWVQSEIVMAKTLKKSCIAMVSKGVRLNGAFSEEERIELDAHRPLPAITKLARTVGLWRREAGRQVRVVPLPSELADELGNNAQSAVCITLGQPSSAQ